MYHKTIREIVHDLRLDDSRQAGLGGSGIA